MASSRRHERGSRNFYSDTAKASSFLLPGPIWLRWWLVHVMSSRKRPYALSKLKLTDSQILCRKKKCPCLIAYCRMWHMKHDMLLKTCPMRFLFGMEKPKTHELGRNASAKQRIPKHRNSHLDRAWKKHRRKECKNDVGMDAQILMKLRHLHKNLIAPFLSPKPRIGIVQKERGHNQGYIKVKIRER